MKKKFLSATFVSLIVSLIIAMGAGISSIAHADLINGTTPCPPNLACNTTIATPGDAITRVIGIVLGVAGLISVLFVIVGGFRYVTAQGDDKKVESAKATLKNAIIGMVVILLAYAILKAIETFVVNAIR